jgi:dTDP-4-amino-4,6-dideoxygalactose transaminase
VSKLALEGGRPVRPRKDFLVFGAPAIGGAEIEEVTDSLRRRWLGTGPKVARFEADFASYKYKGEGAPCAVAVNSCTAALHLTLLALGIGPGDEVITTPMTFCATVNAILHAGATPVLADCEPGTLNMSPADAARKITARTRALLPVHFAGRCCDMDALMKLARKHKLLVVEDCAHAIESRYGGRPAGLFGDAGCFSFYATKNLTTGEGGMVLTRDRRLADKVKRLALHGMTHDAWKRFSDSGYVHYDVVELGYKCNMTDLQAAIGIHQLARLESNWLRRREIWNRYQEAFRDLPCDLPAEPSENERHAYHLYTPLIGAEARRSRDWVLRALTAENIGVGVHYRAVHEHPYYRKRFGWKGRDYPVAGAIGARTVSLPLSAALADKDVADVIRAFRKVLGAGR